MRKNIFTMMLATTSLAASAQTILTVDTIDAHRQVSPMLYGIFYEDINHAADGGLYAELIQNRSFEDDQTDISTWTIVSRDKSKATWKLIQEGLLNKAQHQALALTIEESSKNPVLLCNQGFWGINVVKGRTYRLTFWAKGDFKGKLKARLTASSSPIHAENSSKGRIIYAETSIKGRFKENEWTKYSALLTANANDPKAQFQLVAEGKGTLCLDMVSLFPPTFKNRENGCRPDLAQMLYDLHPKFMRFPGGCFVEGKKAPENAFHWEKTIGPIENRPGHWNVNWNYRTSDGMGFHEYLQLAEDLHAKPLYVVNVGIWHGGFTPVDSIQPWIDECLHALEYANGDAKTTKYGALRAKNGHPQPFNIEYLEIGNENNQLDPKAQSHQYYERFKKFKDAILAKYPKMHLIGNVVAWADDNPMWRSQEPVELVDEHYYRDSKWFADNFHKYDAYPRLADRPDIYVGEYAVTKDYGRMGSLNAALGEAIFMMGMENNSDIVKMASYAPIFANLNDRRWAPDMIQYDSEKAFGTPSYYVQKMMASNIGTKVLNISPSQTQNNLFASATKDEKTSGIIIKIVNRGKQAEKVILEGLAKPDLASGTWEILTSSTGNDENNIQEPEKIVPTTKKLDAEDVKQGITLPAYSLNIIKF